MNDLSSPRASSVGVRVVLRPLASPLPLGFLGLLVATVGFSALQLGWLVPGDALPVALGVLALTVPLQLIACVTGILSRDPVAATGMGVLAGTWGAAALVTLTSPPGAATAGLGVLLLGAAAAMLVPTITAGGKLVAGSVMALSAVRFLLTGIAEITGRDGWYTGAGVVGLVLAIAAWYAAMGFEIEGVHGRAVLPLGRRGSAGRGLGDDVSALQEPGVRQQL